MPKYIIWRRGLRGPSPALLTNKLLCQHDRETKISDPIEIDPKFEDLTLDKLAMIYPPPEMKDANA